MLSILYIGFLVHRLVEGCLCVPMDFQFFTLDSPEEMEALRRYATKTVGFQFFTLDSDMFMKITHVIISAVSFNSLHWIRKLLRASSEGDISRVAFYSLHWILYFLEKLLYVVAYL